MVASQPGSESGPHDPGGFHHLPVLVDEICELVRPLPAGTFLDATVGGAGHAESVLNTNSGLSLLGIDRDEDALAAARRRLAPYEGRFRLVHGRFDRVLAEGDTPPLSGFLFDLGVSSPQLDRADRGFSFRNDGPLDMRMDRSTGPSASEVVNDYDVDELARILRRYGDERFAARIARSIVANRPLDTTAELARVVVDAIPAAARRTGGHPAKRTFQALRIEVNGELEALRPALETAVDALVPGGRGMVLTYHSGEDRIAKDVFRSLTTSTVPAGLPVEQPASDYTIVRPQARKASDDEQARNPRSASARLRTIERVAA